MFFTHFHELKHLATLYWNGKALHVVMERRSSVGDGGAEELVSTHVILKGPSYQSLGINKAHRTGLPPHVVRRSKIIADIFTTRDVPSVSACSSR